MHDFHAFVDAGAELRSLNQRLETGTLAFLETMERAGRNVDAVRGLMRTLNENGVKGWCEAIRVVGRQLPSPRVARATR